MDFWCSPSSPVTSIPRQLNEFYFFLFSASLSHCVFIIFGAAVKLTV